MKLRFAITGVAVLCAGLLNAQTGERVLAFRYADQPQLWQEINNVVRGISEISDVTLDRTARTLTLRGPDNRLAAAEWTFQELDRLEQPSVPNSEMHEFRPVGMGDTVVCVHYMTHVTTPQGIQEIVNAVRSISDMQRVFPVGGVRAVAMRGTAAEIATGKWLFQQLDAPSPATGRSPVIREYRPTAPVEWVARLFFLANTRNPQALQEMVNATRSTADVQRFFPVNAVSAIVMRGSAAQGELCEWLVNRLDTEARPVAEEYVVPGSNNGVVRLFVPAIPPTPQALQELTNQVRLESQSQRVYPVTSKAAVTFRGTAAQAAIAERVVRER